MSSKRKFCPQTVESWGIEFIDDGTYGNQPFHALEPWRTYTDAFELPIGFLLENLAGKQHLAACLNVDRNYINELREDIAINGLKEPLSVMYDKTCNATLSNGHHRLIALNELKGPQGSAPVRLSASSGRISGWGINLWTRPDVVLKAIAKEFEQTA
jgi:hypothetical protein